VSRGQQAFGLEHLAQLGIELNQRAGNAQLDCIGLRWIPPPLLTVVHHVKARSQLRPAPGCACGHSLLLGHEVHFERLAVDFPLARAGRMKVRARSPTCAAPSRNTEPDLPFSALSLFDSGLTSGAKAPAPITHLSVRLSPYLQNLLRDIQRHRLLRLVRVLVAAIDL